MPSKLGLKNNLIAVCWEDHETFFVKTQQISKQDISQEHSSIIICTVVAVLAFGDIASAQMLPPGASRFDPLPPAPPPSPKIEVPVVPQMDAPPTRNFTSTPRPSFSDRINTCLDEGAASGLGPNERAAFSRSCAN
jgi:hypothetical protein